MAHCMHAAWISQQLISNLANYFQPAAPVARFNLVVLRQPCYAKAVPLAVESHPQRAAITELLLGGASTRMVANSAKPHLTQSAVQRFKERFIDPALDKARKARYANLSSTITPERATEALQRAEERPLARSLVESAVSDPLISRVSATYERLDRVLDTAESNGERPLVAGLVGANLRAIELHAKLTGRLSEDRAPAAVIQIGLFDSSGQVARPLIDAQPSAGVAAGDLSTSQPVGQSSSAVAIDVRR